MADEPPEDIFSAWGRVLSTDSATRRRGGATSAPPQDTPPPADAKPPPDGGGIASTAASLVGNSASSIRPFFRSSGQSLDPTEANWCAAFVNGVLSANGQQGTTGRDKNVATSFLRWGVPVDGEPQPGDILVQPRGHKAGETGGHVGIATGQIADGKGGSYYLMQSGNLRGHVAYSWEPASSVVVRRGGQTQAQN